MVLLYLEGGYARVTTLIWDLSGFIVLLSVGDYTDSCASSSVDVCYGLVMTIIVESCYRLVMTIIVESLSLQHIFNAGYRSQKAFHPCKNLKQPRNGKGLFWLTVWRV